MLTSTGKTELSQGALTQSHHLPRTIPPRELRGLDVSFEGNESPALRQKRGCKLHDRGQRGQRARDYSIHPANTVNRGVRFGPLVDDNAPEAESPELFQNPLQEACALGPALDERNACPRSGREWDAGVAGT